MSGLLFALAGRFFGLVVGAIVHVLVVLVTNIPYLISARNNISLVAIKVPPKRVTPQTSDHQGDSVIY